MHGNSDANRKNSAQNGRAICPEQKKILLRSETILMRQEKVLIRVGKFPVGEEEILLADKKFYLVVDDSLSRR
jgi:hypothetical protein